MWSNAFHRHLADVELLASHGVPAPADWLALRGRFAAYTELAAPIADRVAAEVVAPTGLDLAALRALAVAEQAATSVDDAAVGDVVRSRVHTQSDRDLPPCCGSQLQSCGCTVRRGCRPVREGRQAG